MNSKREIREAYALTEETLELLEETYELLNSAGKWGMLDIFGEGLFSGLMKHDRMERVESYAQEISNLTRRLKRELEELEMYQEVRFFSFQTDWEKALDVFLDKIFTDYQTQKLIREQRREVLNLIYSMQDLKKYLYQLDKGEI